jgi:hypothetical protein
MVKKSGAAAIILMKDRRSFRIFGISGSGNMMTYSPAEMK